MPRELSVEQIDQKMLQAGFPEMERIWQRFKTLKIAPEQIDPEMLAAVREGHMAPLFGSKAAAAGVLAAAGAATAGSYLSLGSPLVHDLGGGGVAAMTAYFAVNFTFLSAYLATIGQRYGAYPLHRTMALELAFMLSRPDFREWFETTPAARSVSERLKAIGVTEAWDNPEYKARYELSEGSCRRLSLKADNEYIQQALREFLGFKDPERRKYQPGRHAADLLEGKKSVTQFVSMHQAAIEANKRGELPLAEGLKLLEALKPLLRPGSTGASMLAEYISAAARGDYLTGAAVEACVWRRDPWVDLTHQEEFFSSASLRGVKLMGRGPKGRLGCFGYLYNKSITALDFSTKKGRLVRARLGAALTNLADGSSAKILFVDGVEGSNAVRPEIIQMAIEDYARECSFDAVAYNHYVHNQIPRLFVAHAARGGAPLRSIAVRYIGDESREYLDAFALPLEPFEYAQPAGSVLAHIAALRGRAEDYGQPGRLRDRALEFCKRNALWTLAAQSVGGAAAMAYAVEPLMLIPLLVVTGGLAGWHEWYQQKSVRTR